MWTAAMCAVGGGHPQVSRLPRRSDCDVRNERNELSVADCPGEPDELRARGVSIHSGSVAGDKRSNNLRPAAKARTRVGEGRRVSWQRLGVSSARLSQGFTAYRVTVLKRCDNFCQRSAADDPSLLP